VTVRGTLGLAAVFAVLAGYLALTREPGPAGDEGLPAVLVAVPADRIRRLDLAWGTHRVLATRVDGGWADERGRPWPADHVAALLQALTTLRPLAVIEDAPGDPAVYGLGPDAMRLGVLDDTHEVAALELGASNPAGTALYVRRAGSPAVLLVGALLRWEVEKLRRDDSAGAVP
jgi:hypothetical protein